ncbi:MAG: zinc finger domain-containing protein [Pseudomonadota bacterium]
MTPADWRDDALAARWALIRRARRVVNGALERARTDKTIGASLEAAPVLHVGQGEIAAALEGVDMAELCITSAITIRAETPPEGAFTIEESALAGLGVTFARAEGAKCARCWRLLPEVGRQAHAMTCQRCDAVLSVAGVPA